MERGPMGEADGSAESINGTTFKDRQSSPSQSGDWRS